MYIPSTLRALSSDIAGDGGSRGRSFDGDTGSAFLTDWSSGTGLTRG